MVERVASSDGRQRPRETLSLLQTHSVIVFAYMRFGVLAMHFYWSRFPKLKSRAVTLVFVRKYESLESSPQLFFDRTFFIVSKVPGRPVSLSTSKPLAKASLYPVRRG
eukprot:g807.t1